MTQQPWGGPPDQWNRAPAPWGQQRTPFGAQQQWPAPGGWPAPPQQPGMFPRPAAPPPRRRGPFGALLRAALMITLVMIAFSILKGIAGMVVQPEPAPAPVPAPPTRTATPGAPGSPTTTTAPGGSTGTGSVQYQNEGYSAPPADFNPPDIPYPSTVSQARDWLANNRVYGQNVPSPTRCNRTPIAKTDSTAELQRELNDLMGCLMAVWEPPLRAAGFQMPRPPVTVYTSPVTTACGTMKEINAAYCAADQQVYYARRLLSALPSKIGATKYAAEDVIAHEFGHAVQARTGILIADKALEQKASESEALVMSRRTEQQADCFAGLFVQSVAQSQALTQTDLQNLVDMTYYLGDDALSGEANIDGNHGLGKNRQAWFARGLQTNQILACNTWTVPAASVR